MFFKDNFKTDLVLQTLFLPKTEAIKSVRQAVSGKINSSFQQACFPEMYKTAVVKLQLKKWNMDPFALKSYRSISNLPFISKLIERLTMNCFTRHAETHQLFPLHQSAYRAYHSTETAIATVINDIARAVDANRIMCPGPSRFECCIRYCGSFNSARRPSEAFHSIR